MNKYSIDTNIILRFFESDSQALVIEKLFEDKRNSINVSEIVITELITVLEKFYKISRVDISDYANYLIENTNIHFDKPWLQECIEIYLVNHKISFVDIVAYVDAKNKEMFPLYSFDKALQKFDRKNVLELKL